MKISHCHRKRYWWKKSPCKWKRDYRKYCRVRGSRIDENSLWKLTRNL